MLGIANTTGARIITAKGQLQELSQGYHRLTLTIGEHRLVPGNYSIRFRIWRKSELLFDKDHILSIELLTDHIDDPLLVPLVAEGRDRYGCYCPINISEA